MQNALIDSVWLAGLKSTSFEELGKDRDFGFLAIDSVDYGGVSTTKILDQAKKAKN